MLQLQKYAWLIDTIRRAGRISLEEISDRSCQRTGGYLYYIENPEDIDEDELKKWMLDTFTVGNLISENIALKDRILVDRIPSAHNHLAELLDAMKENRTVKITYRGFVNAQSHTFPVNPYCVKLFENRWYLVAYNARYDDIRIYGLDRIENLEITCDTFRFPEDFSASEYFSNYYGIVSDRNIKPQRIVIRAYKDHTRI